MTLSFSSKPVLLTACALLMASIACNRPQLSNQAEEPQGVVVEGGVSQTSEEALASFTEKWRDINMSTPTGPFSVTFTEAELTAALEAGLDEAEANGVELPPIEDVQVELRNGEVRILGTVRVEPLNVNAEVVAVPSIDANGRVDLSITDASFGVLDLDQANLDDIEQAAEQAINEPIQNSPFNITLNSIEIANGQAVLSGTIN